jgi:hypothetical protein
VKCRQTKLSLLLTADSGPGPGPHCGAVSDRGALLSHPFASLLGVRSLAIYACHKAQIGVGCSNRSRVASHQVVQVIGRAPLEGDQRRVVSFGWPVSTRFAGLDSSRPAR